MDQNIKIPKHICFFSHKSVNNAVISLYFTFALSYDAMKVSEMRQRCGKPLDL